MNKKPSLPKFQDSWIKNIPRKPGESARMRANSHYYAWRRSKSFDRLAENRTPGTGSDFLAAQLWSIAAVVLFFVILIAAVNHFFDGLWLWLAIDVFVGLPLAVWMLRKAIRKA